MKRVVISILIIFMLVFLVGCLDYKAYDVPKNTAGDSAASNTDEEKLLNEIAQIEADLDAQEEEEIESEEIESEVVLPELDEETALPETEETAVSGDYDYLITVDENELAKLNLKESDPDQDNITYTFSPPLDKEGKWKTNYGD